MICIMGSDHLAKIASSAKIKRGPEVKCLQERFFALERKPGNFS